MHARIHRLELQKENLALRTQLDRLPRPRSARPHTAAADRPGPHGAAVAAAPMPINGVSRSVGSRRIYSAVMTSWSLIARTDASSCAAAGNKVCVLAYLGQDSR